MVIFYYDMNTENSKKKKGILISTFYSINFLPFLLDNALHVIFSYCIPINFYLKETITENHF